MFKKIFNYIEDNKFRILITDNKIDINNYEKINYFTETKISIEYNEGKIIIEGTNLKSTKLLETEILIEGNFKNISWSKKDE